MIKKRAVSFVLAAVLGAGVASSAVFALSTSDFSDMGRLTQQERNKFEVLLQNGIFNGYGDGTFGLDERMTRAQFATVLVKLKGLDNSAAQSSFEDVPAGAWYTGNVEAVYRAGIASGVSKTRFNPDGNVTKQELAAFLVKAIGKAAEAEAAPGNDPTVDSWAQGFVAAAIRHFPSLVPPPGQPFDGKAYATRFQLALAAYDMLSNNGDVIGTQTFECAPRSEHEWYRTDRTLVVDPTNPDIMYVSVEYKGVFKTTDGGKTWNQRVKGIKVYATTGHITKGCYGEYPVMLIDPTNPERLLLGTSSGNGFLSDELNGATGGVYESTDGANSWHQLIHDRMNTYVASLAIDAVRPQTIYYGSSAAPSSYAGADPNRIFVNTGIVYKTDDNGRHWEELPTGFTASTGATSVLLNPADSNEIVVSTFSAIRREEGPKELNVEQMGVLHSLDGGQTWNKLADLPGNPAILFGAAAPGNFKHMFFTPFGTEEMHSFVTTDGLTFTPTDYFNVVAYDPFDPDGLHVIGYTRIVPAAVPDKQALTMYESRDGGVTWQPLGKLPEEIKSLNDIKTVVTHIVWHPTDKDTIFMSGGSGLVWKSTDLGTTWTKLLDASMLP